jgi:hypothetical protein
MRKIPLKVSEVLVDFDIAAVCFAVLSFLVSQ